MVSLLENWRVVLYHLDDLEVVEDSGGAVGSLTTGAGTRDPRLQLEENSGNRRPGGGHYFTNLQKINRHKEFYSAGLLPAR